MTCEEKRKATFKEFERFCDWYSVESARPSGEVIIISLTRDIQRADEPELDRLLAELKLRNQRAMLKKLKLNA
jgi:hypothetical protein